MRILIFGGGAIGSLLASYLTRGERDVVAVDPWFRHAELARTTGVRVEAIEEEFVVPIDIRDMDQLDQLGEFDLVVIATKSYDTAWSCRLAAPHLADDGFAISTQNGMNESILCSIFGDERVVGCVVPMAAELPEPARVRRTSGEEWGGLVLGELTGSVTDRVRQIADELSPLGGVSTTDDIESELWGKLTLNVMSNAVSALTGLTTRRLWTDDEPLDVSVALAHELAALANHRGVHLAPVLKTLDHELLLDAHQFAGPAWNEIKARMRVVGESRSGARENKASMLQDITKNRRTEVDHLNGWVVDQCRSDGLPAPANTAIIDCIRQLEIGAGEPHEKNILPLRDVVVSRYAPVDG